MEYILVLTYGWPILQGLQGTQNMGFSVNGQLVGPLLVKFHVLVPVRFLNG